MSQMPDLAESAKSFVEDHLHVQVKELTSVSGGFISAAFKVVTNTGEAFFVKGLKTASRTFEREAYGLELLAGFFKVPKVLASSPHFLILEWIESGPERGDSYSRFARQLAKMHREALAPNSLPGFPFDNTIGATLQMNENRDFLWPEFFWAFRLKPQLEWASEKGFDFSEQEVNFLRESCLEKLSQIEEDCVSLLHGDLWGGNHKCTVEGEAWLFDPSCYYGHREAELAMMRLFGGFPAQVFSAYEEVYPLEKNWQKRLALYQLYHVLNHVNLFGGSYYQQAKAILKDIR